MSVLALNIFVWNCVNIFIFKILLKIIFLTLQNMSIIASQLKKKYFKFKCQESVC